MVCPHCGYEGRKKSKAGGYIVGKEGEFYRLNKYNIVMERPQNYSLDICFLYGCPSCLKLFMD